MFGLQCHLGNVSAVNYLCVKELVEHANYVVSCDFFCCCNAPYGGLLAMLWYACRSACNLS